MSNYRIPHEFPELAPTLATLAKAHGVTATSFELEDTVLRAGGFAWDIGAEAAPLHTEIARLTAEKASADEAERARIAALPPSPEQVWWDKLNA